MDFETDSYLVNYLFCNCYMAIYSLSHCLYLDSLGVKSMKKELSALQISALEKIEKTPGMQSSYTLKVKLVTLNSLYHRHLVVKVGGLGEIAFPHTCILWGLSGRGKRYLEERKGDG